MAGESVPSIARELFDSIMSLGKSERAEPLRRMIDPAAPAIETEWLDFKVCPCIKGGAIDNDQVKAIWSKILSAFANTAGGIVVWGIHAKAVGEDGNKVDRAYDLRHIANPQAFESRLRELQLQAADPPIQGVLIEAIADPTKPGHGFVICYVPASPFAPHRAEYCDKQYFVRCLDKSVVPHVSLLRRLFHPSSQPRFDVEVTLKTKLFLDAHKNFACRFECWLNITNVGSASARGMVLGLNLLPEGRAPAFVGSAAGAPLTSSRHKFTLFHSSALHPGFSIRFADLTANAFGVRTVGKPEIFAVTFDPFTMEFDLYADDYIHTHYEVSFDQDDVLDTSNLVRDKVKQYYSNGQSTKLARPIYR